MGGNLFHTVQSFILYCSHVVWRNNWGIGKLCARFCFKKGGGRQESGKGGIAFPAVHPFRCHSMSIFQRYIPFVSKDDKPIYLHVNLFFISIMQLHPT